MPFFDFVLIASNSVGETWLICIKGGRIRSVFVAGGFLFLLVLQYPYPNP